MMASSSKTKTFNLNVSENSAIKSETAAQLFARLQTRPSLYELEPHLFKTISPSDIIQICGDSGSGKTEFLYHFICKCIFPLIWKDIKLGGLDAHVLFYDTNCSFNVFRLISILESKFKLITKDRICSNVVEMENFVKQCLRSLHVIKCQNMNEFLIALLSSENILGANSKIACIMIDSISSFYWVDRWTSNNVFFRMDQQHKRMVDILKKLVTDFALPIFVIKQKLFQSSDYEFMGRDWQRFVTHNIELSNTKAEIDRTLLDLKYVSKTESKTLKCFVAKYGIVFCDS